MYFFKLIIRKLEILRLSACTMMELICADAIYNITESNKENVMII